MEIKAKDNNEIISQLFAAELQFRLASAVRLAVTRKKQPLTLPVEWTHGKYRVRYNEIALREDQADYAACFLHRSATFLMASEIKNAIIAIDPDAIHHKDENIRNSFQIARFIRNAFTHHPFKPVWSIEKKYQGEIFKVDDIIKLDTTGLHGTVFDWRHYGGPLAILKLCWYVRFEILKDSSKKPSDRLMPKPKDKCYQQGNLILTKVRKIPK